MMINKNNKIIVVATHPDDETLACGGTIMKYKAMGLQVYWVIITHMSLSDGYSQREIDIRESTIQAVAKRYGFAGVDNLRIPVQKLSEMSRNKLIEKIMTIFKKVEPNTVILPFKDDIHSDHRLIFEAAYSCTKVFRYPSINRILLMETISETEFSPGIQGRCFVSNYFVDISNYLNEKLKIMETYESELGSHPFPRSLENIKALATFRGATAGCQFAESFMLIKEIVA